MGYICMVTYGPGQADAPGCLLEHGQLSYVRIVGYSHKYFVAMFLGANVSFLWVLVKQKLNVTLFKAWVFLSLWHFQVQMRLICVS